MINQYYKVGSGDLTKKTAFFNSKSKRTKPKKRKLNRRVK